MAVLDLDEYFIPQPPYNSIRELLEQNYKIEKKNNSNPTKILSFFQTRALPNIHYLDLVPSRENKDDHPNQFLWKKKSNVTFLEAYNCDKTPFPKPASWSWRAKKQIYQPSYVLNHFVHYSLVTQRLLDAPTERSGIFKDLYEKRVDELTEAFMLHTKTTYPSATNHWHKQCTNNNNNNKNDCPIGIPYPPSFT